MEPGDLVATIHRFGDEVWLFKVKRTTEQRAYVDLVEGVGRSYSPAHGRSHDQYLDKDKCIPVRDMEHFARVKQANTDLQKSIKDIKSAAQSKILAAQTRYEAAIA